MYFKNQEPKLMMKSSTSLLNHWKLKHFKAIYELQNGSRKQILSVKNEMFDRVRVSPVLSLILGWICNKAKAVSSFEFKYSFFTMLNLLAIHGISFLSFH